MKTKKARFFILQLFADGGAEGATGADTGATEAVAASQPGAKEKLPITYLDEVKEDDGAEESAAETQEAEEEQSPDLDAEFEALIKKGGKYAEVYEKKFRSALSGRMKENKEQEENRNKQMQVIQKIAQVYGKDADDIDGINAAIDADDNFYSQAAMDAGMSVEAFKELNQIRAENAVYKKAHDEQIQRAEAEKTYNRWLSESEQVKELYPGFDLNAEIQNPVFAGLLRNGFPVLNAFQAAHIDDIVPQAMQAAAKGAEQKLSKSIAANHARPTENAGSRGATATAHRDVASLSEEELDEIDRLSRQRRITLG